MKKILALAVGMLLIPFTAFGMEAMSDGDMDSITGQSGVAISLANIQVYQTGGDELWYRGGSTDAAVGLVYGDSTASYTFITAIKNTGWEQDGSGGYNAAFDTIGTSDAGYERGDYTALQDGDLTYDGYNVLFEAPRAPRVLSIRVLEGSDSGMFGNLDDAHIEIGLPTVEIVGAAGSNEELQLWIGATTGGDSPVGSAGEENFESMGTIYTSNSGATTAIFGGALGITSAASGTDTPTTGSVENLIMEVDGAE